MTIRTVIVDDSPFVREILRAGLAPHTDIEIVGEAGDGRTAEQVVARLRPDVVTMDVLMPLMSGLEAIKNIMARTPTPIVVVSDARGGVERLVLDAISAGALDVFVKPLRGFNEVVAANLAAMLRSVAGSKVALPRKPTPPVSHPVRLNAHASVIGIVASTGGPQILRTIVQRLPASFSVPIVIVQHTASGFIEALASWLSVGAAVPVTVARAGDSLRGVVVAPDHHHVEVTPTREIALHGAPAIRGHRPSGTVLLRSLARLKHAVGVVCTGMGDDGAEGLGELEAAGGTALVEDPQTATIDAMPRAAIAATQRAIVAPAAKLAELLRELARVER